MCKCVFLYKFILSTFLSKLIIFLCSSSIVCRYTTDLMLVHTLSDICTCFYYTKNEAESDIKDSFISSVGVPEKQKKIGNTCMKHIMRMRLME
jgi:hypothetical protein